MSLIDCTKNLFNKEEATFEDTKSLLYYIDENASKSYDMLDMFETYEIMSNVDKYNRRGQNSFANALIKEIPKATKEFEEIKYPIYYQKNKKKSESN